MKMKTTYLTILTVMLLVVMQISCSTKKPASLSTGDIPAVASAQNPKDGSITSEAVNPTDSIVDPYSDSIDVPISYPEMELSPPFNIVESSFSERTDKAESLYVLIPQVDLNQKKYVTYIKNIVKKLIVYGGHSETISILIFDDKDSLEKMFLNPADPDLNIPSHFIARYDGRKEGLTYQYHLEIFPFAPKSNPYVVKHHDVIQFNPFNW
jgi:hypothetical protein